MNILKNSFFRNLAVSISLFSGCIENKVPDIDPCHVDDCRETEVDAGIREIADATTLIIDYSFNDYQTNTVDAITEQDASASNVELDFSVKPDAELDFSVEPDADLPDAELDFSVEPDAELDFSVEPDAELTDMEIDFALEIDAEVSELCEPEIEIYELGFIPMYDNNSVNAFSSSSFYRETLLDITVPENCENFELEDITFTCEGFERRFDFTYLFNGSGELIDLNFIPEFENLDHEIESGTTESLQLRLDLLQYGPNSIVDPSSCDLTLDQILVRDNVGERQTFNIESNVATIQNQPSLITTSLRPINADLVNGPNELVSGDFRLLAGSLNTDENGAALDGHIQSIEFEIRVEDTQIQEFSLEINQNIVIGNVSMDNRTVNFDLSGLNIDVTEDNFAIFDLSITASNVNQSSFVSANLSNIRFTSSAHNEDIVYESRAQDREFFRRTRSILTAQN